MVFKGLVVERVRMVIDIISSISGTPTMLIPSSLLISLTRHPLLLVID